MAATRLIALHKNKGKSVAACLKSRTDYVQNPDKTEQGELVSCYECSPLTVDEEFMLSKRQYELATGRRQKSDIIAYQIRQSFKPGEITAEEANKVGYELAMRFTKGKYAFIVATHTDRHHIHNHVIFNSTALDGSKKFRDFFFSALAVQRWTVFGFSRNHRLQFILTVPSPQRFEADEPLLPCALDGSVFSTLDLITLLFQFLQKIFVILGLFCKDAVGSGIFSFRHWPFSG